MKPLANHLSNAPEQRKFIAPQELSAVTEAADVADLRTPLATLLAGHVVQDGEIVHLVLKPSRWFILLNSLLFIASVAILVLVYQIWKGSPIGHFVAEVQLAILLVAGRLIWSTFQWMGRYYIVTDMRIIRVSGVFQIELFSKPLRKIESTRVYGSILEGLLFLGSIEIIPQEGKITGWQTIRHPEKVQNVLVHLIHRAKQNGLGK